jgi:hypothetical protein
VRQTETERERSRDREKERERQTETEIREMIGEGCMFPDLVMEIDGRSGADFCSLDLSGDINIVTEAIIGKEFHLPGDILTFVHS